MPTPSRMRRIIVMNAKGGCGKTTIATNLASQYASRDFPTALFDYDPQASSTRWLRRRPGAYACLHGVAAYETRLANVTRTWQLRVPPEVQRVVIDTPAGLKGPELVEQLRGVDVILIPVLPSLIDIQSTADFIRDLLLVGKVRLPQTRLGIVANRVRENTLAFRSLERFLATLKIPVITRLRDTQNYVHAAERGSGIHELKAGQTRRDLMQWTEMMDWLEPDAVSPAQDLARAAPSVCQ
ncbi:MAG: ParA family protein [Gammaproteobacteria bacterium]